MTKALRAWSYRYAKQIYQICFFGIVGTTAAIIHISILFFLVTFLHWLPLVANLIAFSIAFQCSYWGHRNFTFSAIAPLAKNIWTKLLLVQVLNLMMNEAVFGFFLNLHLPYLFAMVLTLMIFPVLTFTISKYWIFQPVVAE